MNVFVEDRRTVAGNRVVDKAQIVCVSEMFVAEERRGRNGDDFATADAVEHRDHSLRVGEQRHAVRFFKRKGPADRAAHAGNPGGVGVARQGYRFGAGGSQRSTDARRNVVFAGELSVDGDDAPARLGEVLEKLGVAFVERFGRRVGFVTGKDKRLRRRVEYAERALEARHRQAGAAQHFIEGAVTVGSGIVSGEDRDGFTLLAAFSQGEPYNDDCAGDQNRELG